MAYCSKLGGRKEVNSFELGLKPFWPRAVWTELISHETFGVTERFAVGVTGVRNLWFVVVTSPWKWRIVTTDYW